MNKIAKQLIDEIEDNCKIAPGQTKITPSIYKLLQKLKKEIGYE